MTTDTMEKPAAAARRTPDFSAMSRTDMLASLAATVDGSDRYGNPGKFYELRVTRKELGTAIAQIKGEESLNLVDNESQRKAVVDTLRMFSPAVRDPLYRKGPDGKNVEVPDVIHTGITGMEKVAARFGKGPTMVVRFDRDMIKDIMASVVDRSAMHDSLTTFRSAKNFSIVRQKAFDSSKREAAAKSKASDRGR